MGLRGEMRGLLKRCEVGLSGLPLPDPFSVSELAAAIGRAQGRRIELVSEERWQVAGPTCGARDHRGSVTYVYYCPRPTPHQTEHVILHVLAHEWLHPRVEPLLDSVPESASPVIGAEAPSREQNSYERIEEREAELSAYLIKRRVQASARGADLVSRLESTLSHPLGPRRRRPRQGK